MAKITNTNTKEINGLTTSVAVILNKVENIEKEIKDVKETIGCNDGKYVSKIEFNLVNKEQDNRISKIEKLVFGAVGLALITFGKALLDLVVSVRATQ